MYIANGFSLADASAKFRIEDIASNDATILPNQLESAFDASPLSSLANSVICCRQYIEWLFLLKVVLFTHVVS